MSQSCYACKDFISVMKSSMAYACFTCMCLYQASIDGELDFFQSKFLYKIKRVRAKDWKIGTTQQLQKNQIWDEELEELYEQWIAKSMLK